MPDMNGTCHNDDIIALVIQIELYTTTIRNYINSSSQYCNKKISNAGSTICVLHWTQTILTTIFCPKGNATIDHQIL